MDDYRRMVKEVLHIKNCLAVLCEESQADKYRVGVVNTEFHGEVSGYRAGAVVFYEPEFIKEYDITTDRYNTVTIERAMDKAEIERQKKKGSLLRTWGTMVGVPKNFIKDITDLFR